MRMFPSQRAVHRRERWCLYRFFAAMGVLALVWALLVSLRILTE